MSKWKEYKLGDLGLIITGKTPSKNNPEDWGNEMPFVTPSDYKNYGKLAKTADRNLSKTGIDRLKGKILPANSILVTCIGSDMGKVVMNKTEVITNQQINSIIPVSDLANGDFLYYRLVAMYETLRIYGGDGTAVPIVNKRDFESIGTDIPSLSEQTAIASILSSLDDKIDLLHRQNANLEKMAETLFRQWFVEEAKEEWEMGKLGDYVSVKHGFAFKGEFISNETTDLILVTPGNFKIGGGFKSDKFKYYTRVDFPKEYTFKPDDLIVTMTDLSVDGDTLGYSALIPDNYKNEIYLHNQRVGKIEFKKNIGKYFIYFLMKTEDYQWYILSGASGTSIRHTSPTSICSYNFKIPPENIIDEFEILCSDVLKKVRKNQNQIRTLTSLRDTLLPKLMSGEVRIEI